MCPIVVCPFETLTNYVAALSLRCNFDNQSLVYLPPASTLPLEWLPNIGAQSQMAWMAQTKEATWFVPLVQSEQLDVHWTQPFLAGAVRTQAAETAESVSRTQLLVGGAVCAQAAETAVGNETAESVSRTQLLVTACWRGGLHSGCRNCCWKLNCRYWCQR